MILKIIIKFYRWLWGVEPLVVQTNDDGTYMLITLGACVDIGIIIWIVGYIAITYKKWKRARKL